MKTVRFETSDAVFQFTFEDVVKVLRSHASEDDAAELMDFLSAQNQDVIEIPQGRKSFQYTILDLLTSKESNVFCKACGREYHANELPSFPVGAGENPLKVKVWYQKSPLKRILTRRKRMPLFGGKGYRCPEGHELIAVVTWRT
jgi:hypothetical protein